MGFFRNVVFRNPPGRGPECGGHARNRVPALEPDPANFRQHHRSRRGHRFAHLAEKIGDDLSREVYDQGIRQRVVTGPDIVFSGGLNHVNDEMRNIRVLTDSTGWLLRMRPSAATGWARLCCSVVSKFGKWSTVCC
jgi:hypothetical protein